MQQNKWIHVGVLFLLVQDPGTDTEPRLGIKGGHKAVFGFIDVLLVACPSRDERSPVFRIDLADLLQPVDIRLINAFDPSTAPVVAARTKLAVNPTTTP